ncbi:protein naked cuticle homolog [Amyelois transitella]|uniref:protein naked cuticle homolog n=1 Tax=Amyelois transitella TaxID=680683 RepID=UPI0029902A86|nr:protein naked cuticle homolog [Amyelois transitella]
MTCYETLRTPAPAADAPMAHHFVKWWRNKFRNGYKKFSIGTESEKTDTEELVGRAASQCSAPPDLLPSEARALLQPTTPPPRPTSKIPESTYKPPPSPTAADRNENKQPRLRFEELTCDVELQHPESSKQQPLQFSFTLYDLDGHGRMTKDDIAGIVSTIYESIGKSVTVPHYGSKTIQVRLTVVPEDGCAQTREKREGRRRRRKETLVAAPAPVTECPDSEEERERLSHEDDASSKSSGSGDRRTQHRPQQSISNSRPHRHHRREHRERKHTKKRSGSLQRRELLEIIQANMEKNHMSFQTSRKTSDPVANEEEITTKYQKLRNRSYTVSEKPINAFQKTKTENIGNGYLDLASGGDSNLCRYDRYLHAVICSSARHAHTGYHQKQTQPPRTPRVSQIPQPRSRSHDMPNHKHPRVLQIIFL